ncbi:hypothetical protein ABZZ47_38270 [Streptomyces sp. NPDC006465]|uniref:hypothetical protein n=1 Tax=Streptomyces sp. NPDC006465 TaxID=3157174 RepID=UPI0033AFB7A2
MLFATEPAIEAEVGSRIESALSQVSLDHPDGAITRWQFLSARPGLVRKDEAGCAGRLVQT